MTSCCLVVIQIKTTSCSLAVYTDKDDKLFSCGLTVYTDKDDKLFSCGLYRYR